MKSKKLEKIIIFIITLIFYGNFIRPADWNIASRLGLVKAIVEEKRLTIDSYHDGEFFTEDKAFVNGHYYSEKAIGTSLLGALIYLPIHQLGGRNMDTQLFIMLFTFLTISVPSALVSIILYDFALRMVGERWIALTISLCISLGTPIFPYAGSFYGHSLAAMLAIAIFIMWVEVHQWQAPVTDGRLFVSGLLIGYMVLVEYTTLIIAVVLFGYILFVLSSSHHIWKVQIAGPFLLGAMMPLIVFVTYNWMCFGSPFTVGYEHQSLAAFQEVHNEGLIGIKPPNLLVLLAMTVHPMQGIFLQSPVLFLALGGFFLMARNTKWHAELMVITVVILAYFLVISGLTIWWGGDAFTARHLIPILPFFGILLSFLEKKVLPWLVALGFISFSQMLIASATVYTYFERYILETLKQELDFSWKTSLYYQRMIPDLLQNKLSYTWLQYFWGINTWYFNIAIPMLAACILITVFFATNNKNLTTG